MWPPGWWQGCRVPPAREEVALSCSGSGGRGQVRVPASSLGHAEWSRQGFCFGKALPSPDVRVQGHRPLWGEPRVWELQGLGTRRGVEVSWGPRKAGPSSGRGGGREQGSQTAGSGLTLSTEGPALAYVPVSVPSARGSGRPGTPVLSGAASVRWVHLHAPETMVS